jgi:hypothetical protein
MNTTSMIWTRSEPPRARRYRVTLTEKQAEIDHLLTYGYSATIAVESYTLAEAARPYSSSSGVRGTRPARYCVVFVVSFPAHAQAENAAIALVGFVRGLGGTVEEL